MNTESAEYILRFIMEKNLEEEKPERLNFLINTEGGDVHHAFAIIDMINSTSIPVHTFGIGNIYSSGLFMFMNGAKGHRYLFKNASLMSHQWSTTYEGKQHELESMGVESRNISDKIVRLYAECSGLSQTKVKHKFLSATDVYMTPDEAIKYGFADKIIDRFL